MTVLEQEKIKSTLEALYDDSKNDYAKIIKGTTKSILRKMRPTDFKDAYLSITKSQGEELIDIIKENNLKNIVEFGTSFGISTLFLAQGALATGGHIITTELIESKAKKAISNFKQAGVNEIIEVRIGNAIETLKNHNKPVDLLFLDGWKDLYLNVFQLLEPNFHSNTVIYVDNADMAESKVFLKTIEKNKNYLLQPNYGSKEILITIKN